MRAFRCIVGDEYDHVSTPAPHTIDAGSGKSTLIALIERFYDPQSGSIRLDSVDIKTLNLRWLRQQVALVGQEPVLFAGTVRENIARGKEAATMEQITEAAVSANAHNFIFKDLSDGYETQVGLRGGRLSGGQKQRVAIARAVVRQPRLLLLDEATAALDNKSEALVQTALDKFRIASQATTVTIAHRLGTIQSADAIAVIANGRVAEHGTHQQLVASGGLYCSLVMAQAE